MAKKIEDNGPHSVIIGAQYKHKRTGEIITPFHVDVQRELVRFSPLGSGQERNVKVSEFFENYEMDGKEPTPRVQAEEL